MMLQNGNRERFYFRDTNASKAQRVPRHAGGFYSAAQREELHRVTMMYIPTAMHISPIAPAERQRRRSVVSVMVRPGSSGNPAT